MDAKPPRILREFAALMLVVVVVGPVLSACGNESKPADDDAAWDAYARSICLATTRVVNAVQSQMTPGAGPPESVMTDAWDGFIKDLEKAHPPAALTSWHKDWVQMQKDDLTKLKAGRPEYYDPLDHAPKMSSELVQRMGAAHQRVAECRFPTPTPMPMGTVAAPATPAVSPTRTPSVSQSIDYASPQKYLQAGSQSKLSDESAQAIRGELGAPVQTIAAAGVIAEWLRTKFRTEPAGGVTIGKTDVNTLIRSRVLTGCHDSALVMATVLRSWGVPAIMADTAAIQWAENYVAGKTQTFEGHVFVEAYFAGRWVLVECGSATYASDYDPSNPVITCPSMPDPKGYYAVAKGLDPAGYGVTSGDDLRPKLEEFAKQLPALSLTFPTYQWAPLPPR